MIAIIAILAAILFPVFARAREKARQASCASNLRQIGMALQQYLQDYEERYPTDDAGPWNDCSVIAHRASWGGWVGNLLLPYTKNSRIYECPSNRQRLQPVNAGQFSADGFFCASTGDPEEAIRRWGVPYIWTSYGYNYTAFWDRSAASFRQPADTLVFFDAISPWADCPYASSCGLWGHREIPAFLRKMGLPLHPQMRRPEDSWVQLFVSRVAPHNDTVNFLFADGSVRARRWDRMKWGNLNPNIDEAHPDYTLSLRDLPQGAWDGM